MTRRLVNEKTREISGSELWQGFYIKCRGFSYASHNEKDEKAREIYVGLRNMTTISRLRKPGRAQWRQNTHAITKENPDFLWYGFQTIWLWLSLPVQDFVVDGNDSLDGSHVEHQKNIMDTFLDHDNEDSGSDSGWRHIELQRKPGRDDDDTDELEFRNSGTGIRHLVKLYFIIKEKTLAFNYEL